MFDLLRRHRWLFIVRGILAILFGLLAFIRPEITLATLVLFFGAYIFVDGIFSIVLALSGWEERVNRWLLLLQGIVGLGIGMITFSAPAITRLFWCCISRPGAWPSAFSRLRRRSFREKRSKERGGSLWAVSRLFFLPES